MVVDELKKTDAAGPQAGGEELTENREGQERGACNVQCALQDSGCGLASHAGYRVNSDNEAKEESCNDAGDSTNPQERGKTLADSQSDKLW